MPLTFQHLARERSGERHHVRMLAGLEEPRETPLIEAVMQKTQVHGRFLRMKITQRPDPAVSADLLFQAIHQVALGGGVVRAESGDFRHQTDHGSSVFFGDHRGKISPLLRVPARIWQVNKIHASHRPN